MNRPLTVGGVGVEGPSGLANPEMIKNAQSEIHKIGGNWVQAYQAPTAPRALPITHILRRRGPERLSLSSSMSVQYHEDSINSRVMNLGSLRLLLRPFLPLRPNHRRADFRQTWTSETECRAANLGRVQVTLLDAFKASMICAEQVLDVADVESTSKSYSMCLWTISNCPRAWPITLSPRAISRRSNSSRSQCTPIQYTSTSWSSVLQLSKRSIFRTTSSRMRLTSHFAIAAAER